MEKKKKIVIVQRLLKAQTLYGYAGPMTAEDITIQSWNRYFQEGGELNRPAWLTDNKFKRIKAQYTTLANLHRPIH